MANEPAPEPVAAHSLAAVWEGDPFLRALARETGSLTKWPNENVIGIASCAAMSLNMKSLVPLAAWWAQRKALPQAVPIDEVRPEVRCPQICAPNCLDGCTWGNYGKTHAPQSLENMVPCRLSAGVLSLDYPWTRGVSLPIRGG